MVSVVAGGPWLPDNLECLHSQGPQLYTGAVDGYVFTFLYGQWLLVMSLYTDVAYAGQHVYSEQYTFPGGQFGGVLPEDEVEQYMSAFLANWDTYKTTHTLPPPSAPLHLTLP